MFGLEVWVIYQIQKNGKKYFYKKTQKNNGLRIWTSNYEQACFFHTEEETYKIWEDMGKIGSIEGTYV